MATFSRDPKLLCQPFSHHRFFFIIDDKRKPFIDESISPHRILFSPVVTLQHERGLPPKGENILNRIESREFPDYSLIILVPLVSDEDACYETWQTLLVMRIAKYLGGKKGRVPTRNKRVKQFSGQRLHEMQRLPTMCTF